ncbi:restriction endonuclease [Methylobacterium sp. J-070]|uniref:restriction endonuclease n=1 Tax=Methylobacterium sp. J-070 TaxID=2836650 RepID=UPI001FB90634|nr:restriction endonuclease [Methylobacterium sp. J-070]MCJ2048441.1 restriction endonuclease [Methylobacterium sp. J-070]
MVFVTSSSSSASARETAGMPSKRIVLIDGPQRAHSIICRSVGYQVEETLTAKRLDEEAFEG